MAVGTIPKFPLALSKLLLFNPPPAANLFPMSGILNLTPPRTSLLFSLSGNSSCLAGTGRKTSFGCRRSPCVAAIYAVDEAVAVPESVEIRRPSSLYEVLRVRRNASPTEIKTAYRSLAKLYHPDAASHSSPESGDRDFIEIHNAYVTLSDPTARALYDMSLAPGSRRWSFDYSTSAAGFATASRSGIYPTRRWETDQCW